MAILLVAIVFLFVIGVPISFAIGIGSLLYLIVNDIPLAIIVTRIFRPLNTFPLLAVPFFMLTGEFMLRGGIASKLVRLAETMVGSFRGGLAHINILVSMFFAGITGSAAADSSAVGSLLIPNMVEEGYEKDYSVAVTATSSVIGVIIPPSIPIVMAAITSQTSVGALLLAGVIPGILIGLALMAATVFIANKRNYVRHNRATFKEFFNALIDALPSLFTVIIIVGGIYLGFFTPTESAIVAAVYSLLLSSLVYKKLKFKELPRIFIKVALIGGSAMFLFATASIFSWIVSSENVPVQIANTLLSITSNKIILLLLIDAFLIAVGTLVDTTPAIIILMPVLLPIATSLGVHPIHFGLIMAMGLSIGLATPPVGMCLFVTTNIADMSVDETISALLPYLLVMILIFVLVTFIPDLTLFIPRQVFPYL